MTYLSKLLAFIVIVASGAFWTTASAQGEAPDKLIERVSREIIELVQKDEEVKRGNRKRIQEIVESKILPYVDFETTTALTMGRHWRDASPEQRKRLAEEFRDLLMYTYAGAMSQIKDPTLRFRPLRIAPDETDVEVRSQVSGQRAGNPVDVNYRLKKTPDGWKVYDVNVLGIWLIATYKQSFASEIDRNGIDGLIKTLDEKNEKLAANPIKTPKLPVQ